METVALLIIVGIVCNIIGIIKAPMADENGNIIPKPTQNEQVLH